MQIGIAFGALADSLKEQLREQGYVMPQPEMRSMQQRMHEAINLRVLGFLTPSEADKVERRIFKAIQSHARPSVARLRQERANALQAETEAKE